MWSSARIFLVSACLLITGRAEGDSTTTSTSPAESRLGIVHFVPPPGWQSADDAGRDVRVYASPDSAEDRTAAIVVLLSGALGPNFDFRSRFDKAIVSAADGQPIIEHDPLAAARSRQGFDTLDQTFAFKNGVGRIVHGRLVAARIDDRLAGFCYLASGDDMFQKHRGDMTDLLASVRFEGSPATAPAAVPPTMPSTGPATSTAPTTAPLDASAGTVPLDAGQTGSISVTDRGRTFLRTRYPRRTRLMLTFTTPPPGNLERHLFCDMDRLPETVHFAALPPVPIRVTAQAITPDDKSWPLKLTTNPRPRTPADWSNEVEIDPAQAPSIGVTDVPG